MSIPMQDRLEVSSPMAPIKILRLLTKPDQPTTGDSARHLFKTELQSRLNDASITVIEMMLPPLSTGQLEITLAMIAFRNRSRVNMILADQGLGLRLAVLRRLGIKAPRVGIISYDPMPESLYAKSLKGRLSLSFRTYLYGAMALIVLVSKPQADWLQRLVGSSPIVGYVPMSVDTTLFHRTRPSRRSYIFMVDGAERDYRIVADALSRVRGGTRAFKLTHRSTLSTHKLEVLEKIRSYGYDVEVIHRAPAEELRELYVDCDLVLIPLKPSYQPAGLTALLEAICMECPTVVTQGWSTENYINDRDEALIVPPASLDSLASAIEELQTDDTTRCKLEISCAESRRRFSFEQSIAELRNALLQTFHEGPPDLDVPPYESVGTPP